MFENLKKSTATLLINNAEVQGACRCYRKIYEHPSGGILSKGARAADPQSEPLATSLKKGSRGRGHMML
jgi:hypothetical protein